MRMQSRTRRISKLAILSVLMALPIFTGSPFCSDDAPPPVIDPPKRSSPEELLTNWFENAYNNQDSIRYEEMLHDEFQFEFLQEDAEDLQAQQVLPPGINYWGKTSDLRSTGGMFRSENVGDITLNITIDDTSTVSITGCDECKLVEVLVDLQVVTDPSAEDPLILVVNSPQDFYVTEDPDDPTQWVIFRQFDKPRPGASKVTSLP